MITDPTVPPDRPTAVFETQGELLAPPCNPRVTKLVVGGREYRLPVGALNAVPAEPVSLTHYRVEVGTVPSGLPDASGPYISMSVADAGAGKAGATDGAAGVMQVDSQVYPAYAADALRVEPFGPSEQYDTILANPHGGGPVEYRYGDEEQVSGQAGTHSLDLRVLVNMGTSHFVAGEERGPRGTLHTVAPAKAEDALPGGGRPKMSDKELAAWLGFDASVGGHGGPRHRAVENMSIGQAPELPRAGGGASMRGAEDWNSLIEPRVPHGNDRTETTATQEWGGRGRRAARGVGGIVMRAMNRIAAAVARPAA